MLKQKTFRAFTIVELMLVIVILGILVSIAIVSYRAVQDSSKQASLEGDLTSNLGKIESYYSEKGEYPHNVTDINGGKGLTKSESSTELNYYPGADYTSFCLDAASKSQVYHITSYNKAPQPGDCDSVKTVPSKPRNVSVTLSGTSATVTWQAPTSDGGAAITNYLVTSTPNDKQVTVSGSTLTATITDLIPGESYVFTVKAINSIGASMGSTASELVYIVPPAVDGDFMQTITRYNCPGERIRAVDARDNHTYWIQKMADGNCWMLTNLAYGGGTDNDGTSSYGDTVSLTKKTSGNSYTDLWYYDNVNSNPTTEPASPSVSTDGGVTSPQYGYYYNWCAAMTPAAGGGACSDSSSVQPDQSKSICPNGWHLPAGGTGNANQFKALETALINSSGSLTSDFYIQYGGYMTGSFYYSQGSDGYFWLNTINNVTSAGRMRIDSSAVPGVLDKNLGASVRCLINP